MSKYRFGKHKAIPLLMGMLFAGINGLYAHAQGQTLACSLWIFLIEWILLWKLLQKGFAYCGQVSLKEGTASSALTAKRFAANGVWLFAMWMPYIVLCFPGNIMWDTGDAILHGLGIMSNNNNPFFLNWVYTFVYRFGAALGNVHIGVAVFCLMQMMGYIAALAFSLLLVEEAGAPGWVRIGLLLLYGLIPVFPGTVFCMSKDSIFTLVLLVFCILLYVQRHFEWFYTRPVCFVLMLVTSALLPLMRNGAVYIAVVCLLAALLYCKVRQGRKLLLAAMVLCLLTGIVLPKAANIPQPNKAESLSLPLQQTAYYMKRYKGTEEEQQALSQVINLKVFKSYKPDNADPVKDGFRSDATTKDVLNYLTVWAKQLVKHPGTYLQAFYNHTNGYYTPARRTSDVKYHIYLGYNVLDSIFEDTELEMNLNPGLTLVREIDNAVIELPVLGILQKIGIYTWLLAAAIAYAFYAGKKESLLDYLPLVLVFVACCMSPINAYVRYAFPVMLIGPVLCAMNLFQKQPKKEASSK